MILFKYILHKNSTTQGFTLIELLVASILLAVISALAIPSYFQQVEKARTSEAISNLGVLLKAQQAYRWENGKFAPDIMDPEFGVTIAKTQFYDIAVNPTKPVTSSEVHIQANAKVGFEQDVKNHEGAVFQVKQSFIVVVCQGYDFQVDDPELSITDFTDANTILCTDGKILGK